MSYNQTNPMNMGQSPPDSAHMFLDTKYVEIEDGEFEVTGRKVVTYHNVAPDQQLGKGGSADMFTRGEKIKITGGKFTAAGTITTYHGPTSTESSSSWQIIRESRSGPNPAATYHWPASTSNNSSIWGGRR